MLLGIPRSLFFFYYNPFWTSLWRELEVECLVSPPTTPAILQQGLELALDEFCLPVKVHYGHLAYLENRVDLIFSPAFGRWGKRGHFCPKLKAIHDLVKHRFPRSIEFWHDLDEKEILQPGPWWKAIPSIVPGVKRKRFRAAWGEACRQQAAFQQLWVAGYNPAEAAARLGGENAAEPGEPEHPSGLKIAVLGHPYLVYDEALNQQILALLHTKNVGVYTKETIPPSARKKLWPSQGKEVFWPLGQELLAAALHYSTAERVDGIIFLTACLCGPDAITGELL
jgi:predicted nucleotide-binding protein (sugar kinase/HSP70/actin superfamily)